MARLSELARHVIYPEGIVSTGWPAVRNTCTQLGLGFDEWQDGAGQLILAKGADGKYAADTIVMSIPRQVGKTYLIGAIVLALCINHSKLNVFWTAHLQSTARETFRAMQGIAKMPKVAPHIAQVTRGNGNEVIEFANGSRIEFNARGSGAGRGRTKIDVLVFDEGQHLYARAVDDLVPTTTASPNPLIFVIGTPPTSENDAEHFTALRQEAIDGDSDDTLYIEFSADRGCDPMDRDQWRKANPSFPQRTSARAILRLKKNLKTPGAFEREALGIWDEVTRHQAVVKGSVWAELADVGPDFDVLPDALAVDTSHDRQISIAACWREGDSFHIEEVWAGVDPNAAMARIVQAVRRKRRMPVVIDSVSPANSMIVGLRNKRVLVNQTNATDMVKACGTFLDAIEADTLTHGGQEAIDDALEGARKRPIGTAGGWGWNRKDESVFIAPLVAATLALFGASTVRKPRGEGRRGVRRRPRGHLRRRRRVLAGEPYSGCAGRPHEGSDRRAGIRQRHPDGVHAVGRHRSRVQPGDQQRHRRRARHRLPARCLMPISVPEVGPIKKVSADGMAVKKVSSGGNLLWAAFSLPARVSKTSPNQVIPKDVWTTITGWEKAAGFDGEPTANGMLITGAATIDISVSVTIEASVAALRGMRVMHNGVEAATPAAIVTGTVITQTIEDVVVAEGDVLSMQFNANTYYDSQRTVVAGPGTYIHISAAA